MQDLQNLYEETRSLFPHSARSELQYVDREWIFPHHIDVMLDIADDLLQERGGDEYICKAAIILHDVGLVYKRDGPSPDGHESRSAEYARQTLGGTVSEETLSGITACIKATDRRPDDMTMNQRIVRTCDGYAKYKSVHYFAKAHFAFEFSEFAEWLEQKINSDYNKIEFEAYREKAKPIRDWVQRSIDEYTANAAPNSTVTHNIRDKAEDEQIERALSFLVNAFEASGDNPKPVILHSTRVAMDLYDYGYDTEIVVAALLHDLVEDTAIQHDEIREAFTDKVAEIVQACTYDSSLSGQERYQDLFRRCEKHGRNALIVKAADLKDNSDYYTSLEKVQKLKCFLDLARAEHGEEPVIKDLADKTMKVERRVNN